ncbi:FAD binding domain-containing protein [Roseomonas sp. PWR1]|uniref:FAD binding domain-containing protein n=1 Tax=Roseomonas nitratireducens TaxID=2820810 RepID=A0ABS4AZT9_9PROT|nr:FAD binding domain-containing protein [Neoroseomonas nitratireducens]MBP0466333.1 FAD binding domain-containing protein [Neoroseomonas nitratireducens]
MTGYFRPRSLEEALAIRAETGALPLAGGTDIHPLRTARAAWGEPWTTPVLDLSAVPGLDGIVETAEGWRIGARSSWTDIADARLPPMFEGLQAAAREVGGRQVQNRGTIAGNLVTASPAGDGIPNLLALEAEVELASRDATRRLPVAEFLTGYRATALAPGEIVTALHVPRCDGARGRFEKLGARRYLVISIAMAAAVIATQGDRVSEARIAIGACSPVARRLAALEAALLGLHPSEMPRVPQPSHLAPLAPIDDVRATAGYRMDAALVLLRDLLAGFAA